MSAADHSNARFRSTRWSIVLAAADAHEPGAEAALESLIAKYWYPIYAFLRRLGRSPHDAEDLTQGFFSELLPRDWLAKVSPEGGRFRTFLLACLRNYLGHVHAREMGPTRHPGRALVSIDSHLAEDRYALEPIDVLDPAVLFERRWAYELVEDALLRVREHYLAEGKQALFDAAREHLVGEAERGSYTETAAALGISEGAARVAVSRVRQHFREELRTDVGRTVEDPRDVDEEIRRLIAAAAR